MKTLHLRALVGLLLLTLFSQTLLAAVRSVQCAVPEPAAFPEQHTFSEQKKFSGQNNFSKQNDASRQKDFSGQTTLPETAALANTTPTTTPAHCHDTTATTHDPSATTTPSHATGHGHATHLSSCQPDCSCCWNACSPSLLVNTTAALTPAPQSEQYRPARAELPAAPVEQSLRPPRFA